MHFSERQIGFYFTKKIKKQINNSMALELIERVERLGHRHFVKGYLTKNMVWFLLVFPVCYFPHTVTALNSFFLKKQQFLFLLFHLRTLCIVLFNIWIKHLVTYIIMSVLTTAAIQSNSNIQYTLEAALLLTFHLNKSSGGGSGTGASPASQGLLVSCPWN